MPTSLEINIARFLVPAPRFNPPAFSQWLFTSRQIAGRGLTLYTQEASLVKFSPNSDERPSHPARYSDNWEQILDQTQVIAAVRSTEVLPLALRSPIQILYLLCGNPMNIARIIESVRSHGKLPVVNIDLLQGFSRDAYAIEYLASCGAAGIISTHHDALREARAQNLITILRTFTIDSTAVAASLRSLAQSQPDAIELLPAIAAPLVMDRMRSSRPNLRVIAGGLVSSFKEVERLIVAGVDAVSVSNHELWVI